MNSRKKFTLLAEKLKEGNRFICEIVITDTEKNKRGTMQLQDNNLVSLQESIREDIYLLTADFATVEEFRIFFKENEEYQNRPLENKD